MAFEKLLQRFSLNNIKNVLDKTRANLSSNVDNVKAASKNFGKVNVLDAFNSAASNIPSIRKNYQITPLKSKVGNFGVNYSLNSGQAFLGGMADMGTGINKFVSKPSIPAATQIVRGGFGMTTPINPATTLPFSVANLISSLPQNKTKIVSPTRGRITEASPLQRISAGFLRGQTGQQTMASNIAENKTANLFGMKFDPLTTAGSMAGFVQHPMNKQLFKYTEKLMPTLKLLSKKGIAITSIRGGIEDIILSLPDMPENLDADQKRNWVLSTFGQGAISELFGQSINSAGKSIINSKAVKKGANILFDNLKKTKDYWNQGFISSDGIGKPKIMPRWKVELEKQKNVIKNTFKDQKGAINIGEGIEGIKKNAKGIKSLLTKFEEIQTGEKYNKYSISELENELSKRIGSLKNTKLDFKKNVKGISYRQFLEDQLEDFVFTKSEIDPEEYLKSLNIFQKTGNVKKNMESIGNILKKKKVKVESNFKEPDVNVKQAELIAERFGVDKDFVLKKINQGYSPQKIYEGFSSASQSPTEIRSKEGWVNSYLNNFSKNKINPQVKPEEPKVEPKQTKTEDFKVLDKNKFETELKDRKSQIEYVKTAQTNLKRISSNISKELKAKNISTKDFMKDIEDGGIKYPKLVGVHKNLMENLHNISKGFNEKVGDIENYVPHMKDVGDYVDPIKEVEDGIWIGQLDLKLGSFMERKGKLKEISTDYEGVMKKYMDQFVTRNYLENLKPETKLQETVIDYSRKIGDAIRNKKDVNSIEKPDFIGEAQKEIKPEGEISYKVDSVGYVLRTNDNIMKNIGGKLNEAWRSYRDVTLKHTNNWRTDLNKTNRALQNFIETAAKHEFIDGKTKQYVDDMIADMTTKKQLQLKIYDHIGNAVIDVFSMAHLGMSAKTSILQIFELTKLPAIFKLDEISKGLRNIKWKETFNKYKIEEFDNPYDLKRIEQITGKKVSIPKKAYTGFKDFLFYAMGKAERAKNIIFASVAEEAGKNKGLKGDELNGFVRDVLFRYGNVASKNNRAKLYGNTLGRLLFQYGQYNLKNAQEIVDRVQYKQYKKATGLFGSQILNLAIISAVTGVSLDYLSQQLIPISFGPIVSFTQKIIQELAKDQNEVSKKQKVNRLLTTNLMPTGTQYVRTKEGLAAAKGYDTTPTGKVRYYGDKANLPQTIYAGLFGKSSLPSVRKYYKEGTGAMGDKQSKAFLNNPNKIKTNKTIEQEVPSAKKAILYKDARNTLSGYEAKKTKILYQNEYDNEGKKQADLALLDQEFSDSLDYIRQFEDANDTTAIDTYLGIDDVTKLKANTFWEKIVKDKKAYAKAAQLLYKLEYPDNKKFDLPEKQVLEAIERMGISTNDAMYYSKASRNNDEKTAFIMDEIQRIAPKDRTEMLRYLVNGRKIVNGEMLLADGVINDLYDQGLLTDEEKKQLKNFSFSQDGNGKITPKVKVSGRGSGAKLKTIKLQQPKKANISVPKIQGIDFGGFKAPSLAKVDMNKLKLDPNKYIKLNKQKFSGISSPTYRV